LVRTRLLKLDRDEHALLVTMHHIVSDGWSVGVFVRELGSLYGAYREGRASPLDELSVQYADYARWQRRWLGGAALGRELEEWTTRLAGAPELLELPMDRARGAWRSTRGGLDGVAVRGAVSEALRALSRREGSTLFMTLLAGFEVLLQRYSGGRDVV